MQVLPELGLSRCHILNFEQRFVDLDHPPARIDAMTPCKIRWQDGAQGPAQCLREVGMLQQCGRQAALAQAGMRHADQVMDHQDVSGIACVAAPCKPAPEPLEIIVLGQPVAYSWPESTLLGAFVQQSKGVHDSRPCDHHVAAQVCNSFPVSVALSAIAGIQAT